jgi:anthranilate phosphoribosyltransferase
MIEETGFGYAFMPNFCPPYAALTVYREQMGRRPFLAAVEKMLNVANAETQMVGVFHGPYVASVSEALQLAQVARRSVVVQGLEGTTDLSLRRVAHLAWVEQGVVRREDFDPRTVGLGVERDRLITDDAADASDEADAEGPGLKPSDIERHLAITRQVLDGASGPAWEAVVLNAGFRQWVGGSTPSVEEGMARAREALATGKVAARLDALRSWAAGRPLGSARSSAPPEAGPSVLSRLEAAPRPSGQWRG